MPLSRTRLRLIGAAGGVAAVLALLSALSPWWYTSTTTSGTSSTAEFYPGGAIYASGGGGGGFTSYLDQGLTSVGDLYTAVLVVALTVALIGGVVAVAGIGRSFGKWSGPRGARAAQVTLLAAVVFGVLLIVAVPVAQPRLYSADDPGGTCVSGTPPGPCGSFWGTTHAAGVTTTWGAGLGWWLDVGTTILFGLALLLELTAGASTSAHERPGHDNR